VGGAVVIDSVDVVVLVMVTEGEEERAFKRGSRLEGIAGMEIVCTGRGDILVCEAGEGALVDGIGESVGGIMVEDVLGVLSVVL
jgi:hypothetical protein